MEQYNKEYIKMFNENDYISCLNDVSKLKILIEQYIGKYDSDKTNGVNILFKESLDHYVLKRLSDDPLFINTKEMKNYSEYITRIYRTNHLEVNTNVVLRDKRYRDLIMNKFFPNHKQDVETSLKNNSEEIERIFNKINNNEDITQQELDFVSEFVAKTRNKYLGANEPLLKFIFGKMKDTNLEFNHKVQDAVLTNVPFLYSDGLVSNTRFTLCDNYLGKTSNGPGYAKGKDIVVFNKNFFKNVNIKSISDSNKERLGNGSDFTFFMIVAFHEITHNKQNILSEKSYIENDGLSIIIKNILDGEFHDYKMNHDSDSIEIDANMHGWEECGNFYSKYFSGTDKEKLIQNCVVNAHTSKIRRLFAYKKDKDGNYLPYEEYDIRNLVKIVRDHPELLKKYPMLNKFFNQNGKISRKFILDQSVYTNENCMEFIDYFFIAGGVESMIKVLDDNTISENRINNLISNMYYYIDYRLRVRDKFDYVINHKSAGEYRNNEEFSEEVAHKLSLFHYKKGLEAYKKALPLFAKIIEKYPSQERYVKQSIEYLENEINKNAVNNNEIDNIVDAISQETLDLGDNPETVSTSRGM